MSIWPMMDKLEVLNGRYDVPYGNTIRITLGNVWAQYSISKDEDRTINIGSFVDPSINIATIEQLPPQELDNVIFLLQFARDQIGAHDIEVNVRIVGWQDEDGSIHRFDGEPFDDDSTEEDED